MANNPLYKWRESGFSQIFAQANIERISVTACFVFVLKKAFLTVALEEDTVVGGRISCG